MKYTELETLNLKELSEDLSVEELKHFFDMLTLVIETEASEELKEALSVYVNKDAEDEDCVFIDLRTYCPPMKFYCSFCIYYKSFDNDNFTNTLLSSETTTYSRTKKFMLKDAKADLIEAIRVAELSLVDTDCFFV